MNIASVLQGLATLLWIVFFGLLALVIVRAGRRTPLKNATMTLVSTLVASVLVTIAAAGMVFIEPQERGVVVSALSPTGYRQEALTPGPR